MDTSESNIPFHSRKKRTVRPGFKRNRSVRDPQERFWEKVFKQENGCWIWQSRITPAGYGMFSRGKRAEGYEYAHRLSYIWTYQAIPEGFELDHLCRNRACVNPTHLEAVPHLENFLRGSHLSAQVHRSGFCKRGHPRTAENTYYWHGKPHHCRLCKQLMRQEGLWE